MTFHVTIDQNRITHVDGKPFFLIGARHMPVGGTPEMLRDAGFNGFRALAFGHENSEPEVIPQDMEGIYFWAYLFNRADFTKSPEHESQLRARIMELRSHPALLCYENYNEPTLLYKSNNFKTQPADLAHGTAIVREIDPNHPIWLCHTCSNTVETLQQFNDSLDITGCNPYPLYLPGMRRHLGIRPDGRVLDCIDQSVHSVGKYTDKMMAVAQGRPVWMLIQALANENWFDPLHTPEYAGEKIDESKTLYPTFEQMRFMAYDAVTSGVTGIALAMYQTPATGDIWEDIKSLVGELRSLHDALCAQPVADQIQVTYADIGFTIWDGVRTLARRIGNHIYLFAVNTAFDPSEVTLRMKSLEGAIRATVVAEDREVPIQNGALSDRFKPYDTHVYRVEVIA